MSKKKVRKGLELDMWVMSKAYELIEMLPDDGSRETVLSWLQRRLVAPKATAAE